MNISPIHFARLVFVSVNGATDNRDINNIGMRFPLLGNHVSQGGKGVFRVALMGPKLSA